jgi:hypothetical protein
MRASLTPTSEAKLLELRRLAAALLAKAPQTGFNRQDRNTLSKVIQETKRFFGYSSYTKMAADVGVSSRVLLNRAKRPEETPSLFYYQRTLHGLICLIDHALADGEEDVPEAIKGRHAEWLPVPVSMQSKVSLIGELVADVVVHLRTANDLSAFDDVVNPINRAQLIAILETTLAILKAPLVEVSLLKRSSRWLFRVGKVATDKGFTAAIGSLAGEASKEIIKLIMGLRH